MAYFEFDNTHSKFCFRHIVLQPTTLCNLDCDYCYLTDRHEPNKMSVGVAEAVAASIKDAPHPITILWHGGEPLACGIEHFRKLVEPFEQLRLAGKINHNIQINGTMISPDWCRLFREKGFRVGLSIDGPEGCNVNRVNRANMPAWDRIMKGVGLLKINRIPFGIIAVVSEANIDCAEPLYEFFSSLGCRSVCVNIVESEGLNKEKNHLREKDVRRFWSELFDEWRANPVIRIREFDNALGWLKRVSDDFEQHEYFARDLWPTIAWNGDVLMLSPEFLSIPQEKRDEFVTGNILNKPLTEIVEDSFSAKYVKDYFAGIKKCASECMYFSYCGGGQASNKYFELNQINATETEECRNTRKLLVNTVAGAFTSGKLDSIDAAKSASVNLNKLICSLPENMQPRNYSCFDRHQPEAVLTADEDSTQVDWSDWSDKES